MSLETATWISELDASNPPGGDLIQQGDDHLRLLKTVLQTVFPNASKAFRFPTVIAKTADYTVLASDDNTLFEVSASGAAVTLTLPALLAATKGFSVGVIKTDSSANLVTVDGNGADTINDQLTDTISTQFEVVWYIWSGTEWYTDRNNAKQVTFKSANATLTQAESGVIVVDTTAGSVTLTLPAVATSKGRFYYVKKIVAANTLTLDGNGAETIDGAATLALTRRYNAALIVCDADEWHIIGLYYDIGQVAYLDTAQTWVLLQTFIAGLTANGPATFNKAVVTPYTALTPGATVPWDLSTGSNFSITLGAAANVLDAFANGTVGQRGTLQVIQDATGSRVLAFSNAVYDFAGGNIQRPSPGANEITLYDFEVTSATAMRLTRKWVEGQNSIGHFKEYDLTAYVANTLYTQAHGLGRNPGLVQTWLECTTANLSWAVGDRVEVTNSGVRDTGDGNDASGIRTVTNATNVFVITAGTITVLNKTTFALSQITAASWKLMLRVFE